MAVHPPPAETLGDLLRTWRRLRRKSQLELALDAATTPRYVSFVETGRAQPSRRMIVRLARALDVPLRDRNALLHAAGFAPLYAAEPLGSPQLARVEAALGAMLDAHEPFPAVVMDRSWTVLRANRGAERLFGTLLSPAPLPEPANVLRLMLEPGPVRDSVRNWDAVAATLADRVRRETAGGVPDPQALALVERLDPGAGDDPGPPSAPVVDVSFAVAGQTLDFFSVVATIGTPTDVTAQELRYEAFFPSGDATLRAWGPSPSSGRLSGPARRAGRPARACAGCGRRRAG